MIVLLLRLLFVWFVLRTVIRLVRAIGDGMREPAGPKTPPPVPLVRDPVCGTYVVAANALTSGAGSRMRFFCSENCRRAYALKIAR